MLVVCNNGHGIDLHVFLDVISRTNKYKAPRNTKSFFQSLQHSSKVVILDTLKWNLMKLHKGLDDVIPALAGHVVDIDSRVFSKYEVVC